MSGKRELDRQARGGGAERKDRNVLEAYTLPWPEMFPYRR